VRYLADVNVWLALTFGRHPHSGAAWAWLDKQEASACLMCRMTQQGFLRLATNPKAFSKPLTHRQAWSVVDRFMTDERIEYAEEPADLEEKWRDFSMGRKFSPKVWNDAFLAAFASTARLKLVTFDKGFNDYKGLSLEVLG